MAKAKKKPNLKSFLTSKLRRISFSWPGRNEAVKAARVERGRYVCAKCANIFKSTEIRADHIKPVIDPKVGFVGWDEFIPRMFCEAEGFQVLCTGCHDIKTALENEERRKNRTLYKKRTKKSKKIRK